MPTPVHAILVARPGASARAQLLHTLDALALQTRRPDAITLVMCGDASSLRESSTVAHSVEGIIEARGSTSYADAVALALPRVREGAAVWLLAQDTAPHPDALSELTGALERSPSAALAAPKLVSADSAREIVSLGVTMTTLGRTVETAGGELDQGQHDGAEDALGADIRGLLLRAEVTASLRPDPALGGADEGLDLGVRARGARTVRPHCLRAQREGPMRLASRSCIAGSSTRRRSQRRCIGSHFSRWRCGALSFISSPSAPPMFSPSGGRRSPRWRASGPSPARAPGSARSARSRGRASRRSA